MTNKILIVVKVPRLEKTYNIYVPISKKIKTTIDLLVKTINELSEGHFPLDIKCNLVSINGEVFALNATLKDSNIKNGDTIILI